MPITITPSRSWRCFQRSGLVDNSFFVKAAGIAQDTPNGPPTGEEISWAKIWVARLPDPVISKLLAQTPSLSYMYLDGLPPG
jgi:hypothetical protein